MGFRFNRILKILPGIWVNVSKSGLSTSIGTRGAGINIGKRGITTNAGIPGTGISWRQKLGSKGSWMGVLTLVMGIGLAAYTQRDKIADFFGTEQPALAQTSVVRAVPQPTMQTAPVSAIPNTSNIRYVSRTNSVMRDAPKNSGKTLKKYTRGAPITLLELAGDWAKVRDGDVTGWIRVSVLRETPPPPPK